MNILSFLNFNALKDLFSRKFLSIILLVTSFLSIISTLCVANMSWSKWEDYKLAQIPDAESYVVAEFFLYNDGEPHTEGSVREILYSNPKRKPEQAEFCGFMNMIVEWKDETSVCNVQGNTEGLMDIYNYVMLEGKDFEELYAHSNVCIIKEKGRLYQKGVSVGDKIQINGGEYEVIGIAKYPMAYGDVFLSYSDFMELAGLQKHQYHAMLKYEEGTKLSMVKSSLERKVAYLTEFYTGEEHQSMYKASAIQREKERLMLAVMLLVFAGIHFIVVIWEKLIFEQKRIGIRIALGATFKLVMLENILKTEMLTTIAVLLAECVYQGLAHIQILGLKSNLPVKVIVCIWVGYSVIGTCIEAVSSYVLIKRRNCLWLLKDGM